MNIHPEQEYPEYFEWIRREDQVFLKSLILASGMKAVHEEYILCLAHHCERQYEWFVSNLSDTAVSEHYHRVF